MAENFDLNKIKASLSNDLDEYFVASANGKYFSDDKISKMYLAAQLIDGDIQAADYTKGLSDIAKGLYTGGDDAFLWVSSITQDVNPYHYETAKQGVVYGQQSEATDISDVKVDSGSDGLDFKTALTPEQQELINKINSTKDDAEKTELYAQLVSDNYKENHDISDIVKERGGVTKLTRDDFKESGNLVFDDGQGVMLDVSEMTTGKKTLLNGKIEETDIDGKSAEDYLMDEYDKHKDDEDFEGSVSVDVCGGTMTYHGDDEAMEFRSDYMGEFKYDPSQFKMQYKMGTTTVNGKEQKIAVPICHAVDDYDEYDGSIFSQNASVTLPEPIDEKSAGLKNMDYMFDGESELEEMPKIPDSIKSAHGAFNNCANLQRAARDAKTGETGVGFMAYRKWAPWSHDEVGEGGKMNSLPAGIEDTSYMFNNCEKMEDSFSKLSENVWDCRGMYQGCENVSTLTSTENCKYLLTEMAGNMYNGCNTDLQDKLVKNMEGKQSVSEWTNGGAMDTLNDRANNGVDITSAKWSAWSDMAYANNIIKGVDPSGGGAITGTEALTDGLATYGVQRTADGNTYADSSTWSHLRDDVSNEDSKTNDSNDLLNRGGMALGTFVVSSGVIGGITKSKWAGIIGGVGLAAVPQIIGKCDKLSPMFRSIAKMAGEDSKIGQKMNEWADALEGSGNNTETRDAMNVEQLFDNRQDETKKYTEATLNTLTNTDDKSDIGAGFYVQQIETMRENGHKLAQDANLDVIAYTKESEFQNMGESAVMYTACDGFMQHVQGLANENDGQLSDSQKEAVANSMIIMMGNLRAYSDGASEEIRGCNDSEKADRMQNGLGKMMRTTTEPLYNLMHQMDAQYDIFTDEQKQMIDGLVPEGTSTYSEYDASYDEEAHMGNIGTPEIDEYANELETGVAQAQRFEETAKSSGLSAEEIRKQRVQNLEDNYGWLMDEADKHKVSYETEAEDASTNLDANGNKRALPSAAENVTSTETEAQVE